MSKVKILLFGFLLAGFSCGHAEKGLSEKDEDLIPHRVLKRHELHHYKLSLDIEVPIVEGRLPTDKELADLSNELVRRERKHDRTFICYYLPGMEVDAGAFATGHHNPELEVVIMKEMLLEYPQYYDHIPEIRKLVPNYKPRL